MPTRIVREGINSSPRINALSPLAELFYRRLMTVADDYGRYYASPATLRGACWPVCPEKVTEKQISGWLAECCSGDEPLVISYEVKGCAYIELQNFGQQTRGKSKFPAITCLAIAKQPLSTCISPANQMLSLVGVGVEDEVGLKPVAKPATVVDEISDWFIAEFWPLYPRHTAKAEGLKAARAKLKTQADRAAAMKGLRSQVQELRSREESKIPHPATWINGRRWEDEAPQLFRQSTPQPQGPAYQPWVDKFAHLEVSK